MTKFLPLHRSNVVPLVIADISRSSCFISVLSLKMNQKVHCRCMTNFRTLTVQPIHCLKSILHLSKHELPKNKTFLKVSLGLIL